MKNKNILFKRSSTSYMYFNKYYCIVNFDSIFGLKRVSKIGIFVSKLSRLFYKKK